MAVNKKKSALGNNPLSQGIFQKTEENNSVEETKNKEYRVNNQESGNKNLDSSNKNEESRFLERGEREAVNLRLPLELNDWLNDLLKQGKRRHGSKIPKEVWVQAALELFRAIPVDWAEVDSEESLGEVLKTIESRIYNIES